MNNSKINAKKFSNVSVFGRREQNILYVKNMKKYIPLKIIKIKKKNTNDEEIKQKNTDINDIIYSFYTYHTSEVNKTKNSFYNENDNKTAISFFNKTCVNFNTNSLPFYITETEPSSFIKKDNKKINLNKYLRLKKNLSKDDDINNLTNDFILSKTKYKTFNKLSDFFHGEKTERKEKAKNNKKHDLINNKINKLKIGIHDSFYNAKRYIDNTRKLMLLKYDSLIQKEIKLRIEEKADGSLKLIDDKIRSLKNIKKLENNVFNDRIVEYVKFIKIRKDNEEKYDLGLINQIYSLRKNISFLTNKIRKIQVEKNNIIQWILLQIKIKERKLNLPIYYQKLLELSLPKFENQRRLARANISKITKNTRDQKNMNIKFINNISDNVLNNISQEEINKVLFYRNDLIFKTPEEFFDEIKCLENKNLNLLSKTDDLSHDIILLKERYKRLINNKDFCNASLILQIKNEEIELEHNKRIFTEKKNFLTDYLNINPDKNKKILRRRKSTIINVDHFENEFLLNKKTKKYKLLKSVQKLFNTCKQIKIGKKYSNSNNAENIIINIGDQNKPEMILNMVEFIEERIYKLLIEFSLYKNPNNPNYEFIKKLRFHYKKKRNIEKAELLRIEEEKKNLKLFREIEEKNDRPLFLIKNKKDLHNHLNRVNLLELKKRKKKKIFIPKIQDFLYNDNFEDNIKNGINEK